LAIVSQYITDDQFSDVLARLNIDSMEDLERQELVDRAHGDLEADLCERFTVPLLTKDGTAYANAPAFARNKVLNAMKAKLRQIIGNDAARNLVLENTQRYVDVHGKDYKSHIEALNDPKRVYGFQLTEQAAGAMEPMQRMGLARADNKISVEVDSDPFL
jgi:hypothetical protein